MHLLAIKKKRKKEKKKKRKDHEGQARLTDSASPFFWHGVNLAMINLLNSASACTHTHTHTHAHVHVHTHAHTYTYTDRERERVGFTTTYFISTANSTPPAPLGREHSPVTVCTATRYIWCVTTHRLLVREVVGVVIIVKKVIFVGSFGVSHGDERHESEEFEHRWCLQ
jgi:hypothetical protein